MSSLDHDLVRHRIPLPGGDVRLLQPSEAAELPDAGAVEWAPLLPYWSVVWRSGVALAREVAGSPLAGVRVVELGCGLGLASLAAARAGAAVLATDGSAEALALVERSAHENALGVETARLSWEAADDLVARGPYDLVLAADVLYEQASVALLLSLLPRLGHEAWLAEPGRPVAGDFITQARRRWPVATSVSDGVQIHRLRMTARRRRVPPAVAGAPRADHAALEAPELPADLRGRMQERAEARGG